ncbi:TPA: type IV secretory system conjugative DNA transfer family protein [Streptococcus suis]
MVMTLRLYQAPTTWIFFDLINQAHILVVAPSGGGKTYACKQILADIIQQSNHNSPVKLIICDYKGDNDFNQLDGFAYCYRYQRVKDGFLTFYKRLTDRQSGSDISRNPIYLYFDEWASFILSVASADKKEADKLKMKMTEILQLARSFNMHVICSLQRAEASYFINGSRDNFPIRIGLSRLSDESRRQLFPDIPKELYEPMKQGQGWVQTDDKPYPFQIIVPQMNTDEVDSIISSALGGLNQK